MSLSLRPLISGGNAIGAAIAVVGSVLSNLGTNTQKQSHNREELKTVEQRAEYWKRPLWWLGFSLVVVGSVADFAALGFASQALVSALGGSTTLVSNLLVARMWNKEEIYRTDLYGVASVCVGAIFYALMTPPSQTYTLVQLEGMFSRDGFLVYAAFTGFFMVALLMTIATSKLYQLRARMTEALLDPMVKKLDRVLQVQAGHIEQLQQRLHTLEHRDRALHEGSYYSTFPSMVDWKQVTQPQGRVRWRDQYVYASCAGVAGSMSVLCAGCVSKLVMMSIKSGGQNQFRASWVPYAFVFFMFAMVMVQTHLLNAALMLGDAMTVFPVFQAFWIGFSVVGGVVFYGVGAVSMVGTLFFVLGVYMLVQHGKQARGQRVAMLSPAPGSEMCRPPRHLLRSSTRGAGQPNPVAADDTASSWAGGEDGGGTRGRAATGGSGVGESTPLNAGSALVLDVVTPAAHGPETPMGDNPMFSSTPMIRSV